jgi:FkbM family methyltransferase
MEFMDIKNVGLPGLFSGSFCDYERDLRGSFPDLSLFMDGKHPVVIYGAGRMGRLFRKNLWAHGIPVAAFSDSNSALWGKSIDGVTVISPEELQQFSRLPVLVASLLHETEIYELLKRMGFKLVYPLSFLNFNYPKIFISPEYDNTFNALFDFDNKEAICSVYDMLADEQSRCVFLNLIKFRLTFDKKYIRCIQSDSTRQYFDDLVLPLSNDEVFFDCGAYTGDTLEKFCYFSNKQFRKIYAFEPDRNNYLRLLNGVTGIGSDRITPVNSGVYRRSGEASFLEEGAVDSRITPENNSNRLPVISIDDFCRDNDIPTYIKMDIEGSEIDALEGARQIIQTAKPKLAVAVYHKAADLWQIPLLIKRFNSDYRLFLRHYTPEIIDTVCYAL